MRTDFKVMDAMTKNPICISEHATATEAAQLMNDKNVGSLLVTEDKTLKGVLTEYDIVRKVVASGKDPHDVLVGNIMCRSFHTIEPNADLFDAINIMSDLDIRHLPVIHKEEFIGFLTAKDILKIEPALFEILIQGVELREESDKPVFGGEDREDVLDYDVEDDED